MRRLLWASLAICGPIMFATNAAALECVPSPFIPGEYDCYTAPGVYSYTTTRRTYEYPSVVVETEPVGPRVYGWYGDVEPDVVVVRPRSCGTYRFWSYSEGRCIDVRNER